MRIIRYYYIILYYSYKKRNEFEMIEYMTEKPVQSDTFRNITEFIKIEKKNNKKAKRNTLFDTEHKISKSSTQNNTKSPDFYKLYSQELENHIDELLQSVESLQAKVNENKTLDEELMKYKVEARKYKKFQKLANVMTKEKKAVNKNKKEENNSSCNNAICSSNLVNYVDLQKEYDKLLLENTRLRNIQYNNHK